VPGNQVKNWAMYEDLRAKGFSKQSAARITNSQAKRSAAAKKGHQTRKRNARAKKS
jgi:hypothetical protein